MKVVRLNTFNGDSKLKAFFDIQTEEGIVIKGFKLVDGPKGFFISPPSEKAKDGNYYDTTVIPVDMKKSLEKLALDEYKKNNSIN